MTLKKTFFHEYTRYDLTTRSGSIVRRIINVPVRYPRTPNIYIPEKTLVSYSDEIGFVFIRIQTRETVTGPDLSNYIDIFISNYAKKLF